MHASVAVGLAAPEASSLLQLPDHRVPAPLAPSASASACSPSCSPPSTVKISSISASPEARGSSVSHASRLWHKAASPLPRLRARRPRARRRKATRHFRCSSESLARCLRSGMTPQASRACASGLGCSGRSCHICASYMPMGSFCRRGSWPIRRAAMWAFHRQRCASSSILTCGGPCYCGYEPKYRNLDVCDTCVLVLVCVHSCITSNVETGTSKLYAWT